MPGYNFPRRGKFKPVYANGQWLPNERDIRVLQAVQIECLTSRTGWAHKTLIHDTAAIEETKTDSRIRRRGRTDPYDETATSELLLAYVKQKCVIAHPSGRIWWRLTDIGKQWIARVEAGEYVPLAVGAHSVAHRERWHRGLELMRKWRAENQKP